MSNLSEVRIWFVPSQNRWSVVLDVMRMIEWIRIERLPIGASPYRFWIQNVKWIRCHVNFAMFCRLIRIMHTFPGLQRTKMELSHSWIWGALATMTVRATKTSLSIKMNVPFLKDFLAFGTWDRTQFQVRTQRKNWMCPCVNVLQTASQKEI